MQRSRNLYEFLSGRGAPTAIQLIEPRFNEPRILLFYPKEKEVFAADLYKTGDSYEWIVRGPFGIEREDFRTLARMENDLVGDNVFLMD